MCEALRAEIEFCHGQRKEKVEAKVSVRLIDRDPSKKVSKNKFHKDILLLNKY